jgi:hypothetical protein
MNEPDSANGEHRPATGREDPAAAGAGDLGGGDGEQLLATLGLKRGEAAEVLHQHLMARRQRFVRPSGPASSKELAGVLRTYAARKAAFAELLRQGKLPPRPADEV